jgi:hypothetical protein
MLIKRFVITSVFLGAAFLTSSPVLAHITYAYNGSDYARVNSSHSILYACDRESDSHTVKGAIDLNAGDGLNENVTAIDGDGSNGNCASRGGYYNPPGGDHIHACEKSWTWWGCGNWVYA